MTIRGVLAATWICQCEQMVGWTEEGTFKSKMKHMMRRWKRVK